MNRVYVSTTAKTLIGVLVVAFALFALASTGFSLRDRAQNRANVERDLLSNADAVGEELTGWFEGRLLLVRFASDVISQTAGRAGRERAIRNETVNRSFEEVFFGDHTDGQLVRSRPIDKLPADYDARTRPWYIAAAKKRDTVITEPYLSAGERGMVVTIAVPLVERGKLLGVTGSDFKLNALTRIMHRHHGATEGIFFLVDDTGKILLHNDRTLIGRTLASVFDRPVRPSDTVVRDVAQAGVAKLVGFQPIRGLPSERRWYVGVSMDAADATAPLAAVFQRSAITTGIIVIAMLGGFVAILVGIVLRPLKTMTGHIREIAAGRLNATIPYIERADEIGDMARALTIFRDNGREVEQLREQDRIRSKREAENRARMMHELQAAFGQVVDAASQGDLHRRVTVDFADVELNALAASVNMLIATIGRGLDEACDVLSAIAQTDLTRRVEGDYSGAFDAIKRDSNAVADRLSVIVQQLKGASHQLRRGIVDLTAGGRRLADCAAEQSAAVRGTSAEVQVIADIVSRHAADADAASLRAREASAAGEAGGRVMREASAAMKRMTDASDRVVTIADVLDEIAQQTALVALNAGIEAERAGAAGRTFSVVADEVRHLANHAKAASQDVKETIGAAVEEVTGGARMMAMVEVELMAMLRALNQNSTVLDEIAAASRQQSESIQTIRQSVGRFDAVAQDNLTLVRDIETITGRVENQASELDGIVDVFTLDQPAAAARVARAA